MDLEGLRKMRLNRIANQLASLHLSGGSQSSSKILVPVKPSQTVLAQFRHISGFSASKDQRALPLFRVQVLNNLIDNLQKRSQSEKFTLQQEASSGQINALIQQYATELHQIMKSSPEVFGTLGDSASSGIVFQLNA